MPQPEPVRPRAGTVWAIGHRGFPRVAPENTLVSFLRAVEAGAEMVEFDVLLTCDGIPIVIHDPELDRTTDGTGKVARHTLAELKRLDAGKWFSPGFVGERLPTLGEVLEALRGKAAVNVEIKTEAVTAQLKGGIEERVIAAVNDLGWIKHAVVSSFDPRAVLRVKEIDPSVPTALLLHTTPRRTPYELASKVKADALHVSRKKLTGKFMELARADGIPVRAYTVNDPSDVKKLIDWGVDGIFSDDPGMLVRAVREATRA